MEKISQHIRRLIDYAVERGLCEESDRTYMTNRILSLLGASEYIGSESEPVLPLEGILADLLADAGELGTLKESGVVYRDLFDTELMSVLTPRPSEVIARFFALYRESPKEATDYFYRLAQDSDYIRTYRVCRDLRWQAASEFGAIDLSINLSKPEKDPKAIAAAKLLPQSGYPKCALCHENEGYRGSVAQAARGTLRQIPLTLDGESWYLQYSPYVYYNEHCILLSGEHTPMKISEATFRRQLDFVEMLPHYFIGSNADLPIVGGSILSHDHMQGGRYVFPMERAEIEIPLSFKGYPNVTGGIVKWPMSVIRLRCKEKLTLVSLAAKVLDAWRGYTDEEAMILAETDGEPHNTVTPICRMRGGEFELDLVLRNNLVTEEHPLGLYHPHAELHHIKKENIGLIEVMGLAVLPARLKDELLRVGELILKDGDLYADPATTKHAEWVASFRDKYAFTPSNVTDILKGEVGNVFVRVLSDAGVYKTDAAGRAAFMRFAETLGLSN